MNKKSNILIFFSLLLGAFCLYYWYVNYFDYGVFIESSRKINYLFAILLTLSFTCSLVLRVCKWGYMVNRFDTIKWKEAFYLTMLCNWTNLFFPIRIGDAVRCYGIKKTSSVSFSTSISVSFLDRVTYFAAVFLFLFLTPLTGFRFSEGLSKFILFFLFFFFCIFGVFIWGNRYPETTAHFLIRLTSPFKSFNFYKTKDLEVRLRNFFLGLFEKSNLFNYNLKSIFLIAVFSFLIICLDGLCFKMLMAAFGLDITWLQGCLGGCFTAIFFLFPSPPGQVGTAEMYPVIIFSLGLGLNEGIVAVASLFWHVWASIIITGLGFLSAVKLGISIRNIVKVQPLSHQDTKPRPFQRKSGTKEKYESVT